jgi:hypothetical protein
VSQPVEVVHARDKRRATLKAREPRACVVRAARRRRFHCSEGPSTMSRARHDPGHDERLPEGRLRLGGAGSAALDEALAAHWRDAVAEARSGSDTPWDAAPGKQRARGGLPVARVRRIMQEEAEVYVRCGSRAAEWAAARPVD